MSEALIQKCRANFHKRIAEELVRIYKGAPSFSDKNNNTSVEFAKGICKKLPSVKNKRRLSAQSVGRSFEAIVKEFLECSFLKLSHLRPGNWKIEQVAQSARGSIGGYVQFQHLASLAKQVRENKELLLSLGNDYEISPDLVILREPEEDAKINKDCILVNNEVAMHADLRKKSNELPILHASISCKWSLRSDRAQSARAEALGFIRNRKGRTPHIIAVTMEPLPSRIASLALGTGDIDCVYHSALRELLDVVESSLHHDARDMIEALVKGRRLKDISDLPLDLAV